MSQSKRELFNRSVEQYVRFPGAFSTDENMRAAARELSASDRRAAAEEIWAAHLDVPPYDVVLDSLALKG